MASNSSLFLHAEECIALLSNIADTASGLDTCCLDVSSWNEVAAASLDLSEVLQEASSNLTSNISQHEEPQDKGTLHQFKENRIQAELKQSEKASQLSKQEMGRSGENHLFSKAASSVSKCFRSLIAVRPKSSAKGLNQSRPQEAPVPVTDALVADTSIYNPRQATPLSQKKLATWPNHVAPPIKRSRHDVQTAGQSNTLPRATRSSRLSRSGSMRNKIKPANPAGVDNQTPGPGEIPERTVQTEPVDSVLVDSPAHSTPTTPRAHRGNIHPGRFDCSFCSASFSTVELYQRHRLAHALVIRLSRTLESSLVSRQAPQAEQELTGAANMLIESLIKRFRINLTNLSWLRCSVREVERLLLDDQLELTYPLDFDSFDDLESIIKSLAGHRASPDSTPCPSSQQSRATCSTLSCVDYSNVDMFDVESKMAKLWTPGQPACPECGLRCTSTHLVFQHICTDHPLTDRLAIGIGPAFPVRPAMSPGEQIGRDSVTWARLGSSKSIGPL